MFRTFIFICLLASTACFSQNKFTGKWKVTEVDANSNDFYFNVESDSVSLSPKVRNGLPKDDMAFFIKLFKDEFEDKYFFFTDSVFEERSNAVVLLSSPYRIDASKKMLFFDSDPKRPEASFEFLTDDRLLITWVVKEKPVKIKLKKVN